MKQDLEARATGESKPPRARSRSKLPSPQDRSKQIIALINGLAPRHRRFQVFQDIVTMMGCAISNSVDKHHFQQREEMYLRCAQRYTREEWSAFPQMLGELTMLLEEAGPDDVLGRLYMQLELGNEHSGQFFTPMHVCELMARITYSDGLREKVAERGFVTVNDPASGGAAMLIAFAKNLAEQGLNYQQQMHATAVDLDITAAMMSYVQMSLLHIPAIVVHGNSLTLEEYSAWRTPAHILGNWDHKLARLHKEGENAHDTVEPAGADLPRAA